MVEPRARYLYCALGSPRFLAARFHADTLQRVIPSDRNRRNLHRKKDIETIEDVPIHSQRPSSSRKNPAKLVE
jgi:hypothetical protein